MDDQDFSLPSVGTGQLDGQKEIERILHSATNRFEKLLQASMLVSPTAVMRCKDDDQREFAASDLTICNGCKDLALCKHHFHSYDDPLQEPFQKGIVANVRKASAQIEEDGIPVMAHFLMCKSKIVQKLSRCGYRIRNEAELRYTTGDPLMEMLCDIFSLQVSSNF